jgi:hypothetical protein
VNARTSLVLMVAFVVLGTFALFDPLHRQEKADEKRERESHVVWLKGKSLRGIEISGAKEVSLECARKDKGCPFDGTGEWGMSKPLADKADPSAVGSLASSLLNLTAADKLDFEKAPDPKEFGLDQPQAVVKLKFQGEEKPLTLTFGRASPTGPNVYLSTSENPLRLFLVPAYLTGLLTKDPFHWRNKRLFPTVEVTAVSGLNWRNKKGEVFLSRDKDEWRMIRPKPVAAGKTMAEGLGSIVVYGSAKTVFAPSRQSPEAKKALAGKPELDLQIFLVDGTAHQLKLFARPTVRGAKESLALVDGLDTVFTVDASPFERFQKDLLDYRRRTLLDEEGRGKLDEMKLTFPREGKEAIFKKSGEEWKQEGGTPIPGLLSLNRLRVFLDSLRDTEYKGFFPLNSRSREALAYRGQKPDLIFEAKSGGKLFLQARFLAHDRKIVLTESEGEVRTLGDPLLKTLPVRLQDLTNDANKTVVVKEKGEP